MWHFNFSLPATLTDKWFDDFGKKLCKRLVRPGRPWLTTIISNFFQNLITDFREFKTWTSNIYALVMLHEQILPVTFKWRFSVHLGGSFYHLHEAAKAFSITRTPWSIKRMSKTGQMDYLEETRVIKFMRKLDQSHFNFLYVCRICHYCIRCDHRCLIRLLRVEECRRTKGKPVRWKICST